MESADHLAIDWFSFLLHVGFNIAVAFIAIRLIYYPKSKDGNYLFTFSVFNLVSFLICYLLQNTPIEMGFALGLFAVFGILRYRTETLPIKEMTYLFLIIGIAMINALSKSVVSWEELIFANGLLLLAVFLLETFWSSKSKGEALILLDEIPDFSALSKTDILNLLSQKSGLKVLQYEVLELDFLRETCRLKLIHQS